MGERAASAYPDLVKEVGTKSAAAEAVLAMVLSDDQVDGALRDLFQAAMAE